MIGIRFIRNKWLMMFFALMFFGLLWGSFQWVYRREILLRRLYYSGTLHDQKVALTLYEDVMESGFTQRDPKSLSLLAEILAKMGKKEEAIRIWDRLVSQLPEDRAARFRLAVALHNHGKYLEAEKHFNVLLRGVNEHE